MNDTAITILCCALSLFFMMIILTISQVVIVIIKSNKQDREIEEYSKGYNKGLKDGKEKGIMEGLRTGKIEKLSDSLTKEQVRQIFGFTDAEQLTSLKEHGYITEDEYIGRMVDIDDENSNNRDDCNDFGSADIQG